MSLIRDDDLLFNSSRLEDALSAAEAKLKQEIERYDESRLLNTSPHDLCAYFVQKFRVEPIELREGEISIDQREATVDVRRLRDGAFFYGGNQTTIAGTAVEFFVPFTGDHYLLVMQPNHYTQSPPRAKVREAELVFRFVTPAPESGPIRTEFERQLGQVKQYLQSTNSRVRTFNESLEALARKAIDARRARLLQAKESAASLGYPMRRRDGAPTTYAAPVVRRKVAIREPVASSAPYVPEPALAMEEYEHIIDIMQNMALVLERSPSAFKGMHEEDLRQHFLVQLNGHYEGSATGETFNVNGKTDILVRHEGKNIFIAECKFWSGPAGLTEAIDQLLGYTSWRDTKTAVVVFNRDTTFSTVLGKIPETVRSHANFKRQEPVQGETRFRAVLHHKNDSNRELLLTVLAFDVPH